MTQLLERPPITNTEKPEPEFIHFHQTPSKAELAPQPAVQFITGKLARTIILQVKAERIARDFMDGKFGRIT